MRVSLSQRDAAWASVLLPGTKLTIGRYGCLVTSIADLSSYFGNSLRPDEIAGLCKFTPDGLLYWNTAVFKEFEFERREQGFNPLNIVVAIQDPNRGVALQVANGSHWVVGEGYDTLLKKITIADPWLGDMCEVSRYSNITGAAYFKRK